MTWFRFPLAVSNKICEMLRWQPLALQPEPLHLGTSGSSGPKAIFTAQALFACQHCITGNHFTIQHGNSIGGVRLETVHASSARTPPAWWRQLSSWQACTATIHGLIAWWLGVRRLGWFVLCCLRHVFAEVSALIQAPPGRYVVPCRQALVMTDDSESWKLVRYAKLDSVLLR